MGSVSPINDQERATYIPRPSGLFNYTVTTGADQPLCPDLLRLSDIGEADGWRGRVVRGFFRVLKVATGL